MALSLLASCATPRSVLEPGEPLDACQALRSPGFDEIMERAVRRGLVERVAASASGEPTMLAPGRLYAQAAQGIMLFQLTQRAVDEGVPQRVGTIVYAGCSAAFMAIWHLVRRASTTAAAAAAGRPDALARICRLKEQGIITCTYQCPDGSEEILYKMPGGDCPDAYIKR